MQSKKLFEFNKHLIKAENATFHYLFEIQERQSQNSIAILCDNYSVSYSDLNIKANKLANQLLHYNLKSENIVAVFLDRQISIIVSILAILKSGGAFILIDKSLPENRIKYIINDCQPTHFISNDSNINLLVSFITPSDKPIINLDNMSEVEHNENPNINVDGNNLAYIMYTSGSTGKPKGVMIEHKGLANTLLNQKNILSPETKDHVLSMASISCDAFLWEIGCSLLSGCELYLLTEKERKIKNLSNFILTNKISIATLTPSVIRVIPKKYLASLRILISAGEAFTTDLFESISDDCIIYNAYGPTETSICATMAKCQKNQKSISLGDPLKNIFVYALKNDYSLAEPGELGNLFIGGIGLFRGYINQEKNRAVFFYQNLLGKLYNTHDLVLVNSQGKFEYIGRTDDEIKICGNRVNLNEIRLILSKHREIKNCIVRASNLESEKKIRIIVIIETYNNSLSLKEIRAYLSNFLPNYMLPNKLIKTNKISHTLNTEILLSVKSY